MPQLPCPTLDTMASPPVRVVHITDTHLFADAGASKRGLVHAASAAAVLADACGCWPRPDAVLLTGDFTQDESFASYALLARLVRAAWPPEEEEGGNVPVFFLPGNHDVPSRLAASFRDSFSPPWAGVAGGDAPCDRVLIAPLSPAWDLLLLSTHLPPAGDDDRCDGGLGAEELAGLAKALAASAASGRRVLLAMHHPPLEPHGPAVAPWGGSCLRAEGAPGAGGCAAAVAALLAGPTAPAVVVHGHLHAELTTVISPAAGGGGGGCVVYCTPSTCGQTRLRSGPGAQPPTGEWGWESDAGQAPGWRALELRPGGGHASWVSRLPGWRWPEAGGGGGGEGEGEGAPAWAAAAGALMAKAGLAPAPAEAGARA